MRIAVLALLAAGVCSPCGAAGGWSVQIQGIGTLGGGGSQAFAINEAGLVVGWSAGEDRFWHAVAWEHGELRALPRLPGAYDSKALGVNESGQIIGHAYLEAELPRGPVIIEHAVLWEGDAYTNLNALMGTYYSYGLAINDHGVVVGEANQRGFVWSPGRGYEVVGLPVHDASTNRSVNNDGVVVGDSYFFMDPNDAHVARPGPEGGWVVDNIGPGLFSFGMATDINDAGVIVGDANFNLNGPGHAVIFTGRVVSDDDWGTTPEDWYRDLGRLGDLPRSTATAINNRGWVVGLGDPQETGVPTRAFVWPGDGPLVDLNDLLPRGSGWLMLLSASDINDQGQIVGSGVREDWSIEGFVMTITETCAADRDGDGRASVADLVMYLGDFGRGDADMDADRDTDVNDLLAYLAAFGAGC